jgi:ribosomal protein S18 acetylase RimI-like enzyme
MLDSLVIRQATLDDVNVIQDLNHKLFQLEKENFDPTLDTNWPLSPEGELYFENLIKNNYVVLAIIGGVVIGYLAGSINDKVSYSMVQYGEINNMLIDERYRRYGIGKTLIGAFEKYCVKNNIYDLKVTASAKNMNAIEFYKKQGFDLFDVTLTSHIHINP